MLRKSAVILVSILFTALFSTMFFTGCEDSLLTEPAMSESAMPGDLGDFSLAKGNKPPSAGGFDEYGYNYEAYIFNGRYCDYDRVIGDDDDPLCDIKLIMKWSEEWLNEDRIRCAGTEVEGGSACEGAWLTNHQSGAYEQNGATYRWNYFVKIVFPGDSAYTADGYWHTADSVVIGPALWGAYAIIQQVYNDQGTGEHGIEYKSPASPGFGFYSPDSL